MTDKLAEVRAQIAATTAKWEAFCDADDGSDEEREAEDAFESSSHYVWHLLRDGVLLDELSTLRAEAEQRKAELRQYEQSMLDIFHALNPHKWGLEGQTTAYTTFAGHIGHIRADLDRLTAQRDKLRQALELCSRDDDELAKRVLRETAK
jgi:hypothetical protein